MKTKKFFFAALTVMCTMALSTVITSCGDDEDNTVKMPYKYIVNSDTDGRYFIQNEYNEVQAAFNAVVGNGTVYYSSQDEAMKSGCETVKNKYANINSVYLKFHLIKYTPNSTDTIATYELGQAFVKPCMDYAFISNGAEAYAALDAKEATIGEKIYKASGKTLRHLVGIHQVYDGTERIGGMKSYFEKHFEKEFNRAWDDSYDYDKVVAHDCDSIANALANDTLAVDVKVAAIKIGVLDKKISTIWERTIPANIQ